MTMAYQGIKLPPRIDVIHNNRLNLSPPVSDLVRLVDCFTCRRHIIELLFWSESLTCCELQQ